MKITLQQATICLGKRAALRELSVQLEGSGITAVLGRNGAGKTTLLRTMAGLLRPSSGKVLWDQEEISSIPSRERAKKLSYLPQREEGLYSCSVAEFVEMGLYPEQGPFGNSRAQQYQQRVHQALLDMNLEQLALRPMDQISGGERRRAYLARCLVQRSQWMVLDEPLVSLDYPSQQELWGLLERLCREYEKRVILSVHNPDFVLRGADRVLVLDGGRLCGDLQKEQGWEKKLLEVLRTVYGQDLSLVFAQGKAFFYWR